MRKIYLLIIIVVGLFSLALYSTYAMFTMSVETDDFVNLSASSLLTETQILEYERITINAKDIKIIDFNINNNTTSDLYYGAWYNDVSVLFSENQPWLQRGGTYDNSFKDKGIFWMYMDSANARSIDTTRLTLIVY